VSVVEIEALRIANRFKSLPKFPRAPEGISELVKAMQTAKDNIVADRWASDWIRKENRAPLPADIYGAFNPPGKLAPVTLDAIKLPDGNWAPPKYKCNLCEDSGFYIMKTGKKIWNSDIEYEAAHRCHHPAEYRGKLYGRNL